MQRAKRDYTIDVVVRGLVILETLAVADRDLGVLELSEIVKIPVSTVYRLLSTLQSRGCVEKDLETDKYRLGIRLFELGMARIKRPGYRNLAIALRALQSEINETVFVGILRENEVLIIDEFSQYRGIVFSSQPGAGEPLYCTGVGKALLAHAQEEERDRILKTITLRRFTPNTITSKRELRAELKRIKERGYSIDDEEIEVGVKCVAAPILRPNGSASAAFSVAGPKDRIEARLDEIISRVLKMKSAICSATEEQNG